MTTPVVIVGCAGMGREVHDVIDHINAASPTWDLLGYIDDGPGGDEDLGRVEARGSRVLGGVPALAAMSAEVMYVVGIGSGQVRRGVVGRLGQPGRRAAVLVDPSVSRGFDVQLGEGTVFCPGVRVTTNMRLGRHVIINNNATVGHDSTFADFVTVNPAAAVSGAGTLGECVTVGAGAVVLQTLTVGEGATIGAAACIVRDVAAGSTVTGVPAR